MEPTSTPPSSPSLPSDVEATHARINQKRRQRADSLATRSVQNADGTVDMRLDASHSSVPAPYTRAERLQSFVEQLRSTNQAAVAKTATLRPPAGTEILNRAALLKARYDRLDGPPAPRQAAQRKANQDIAAAIEALDASRKRYAELVAEEKLGPEHEAIAYSSDLASTKEDLVASISAAIATVLTDLQIDPQAQPLDLSLADVAFAEPEPEPKSSTPISPQPISPQQPLPPTAPSLPDGAQAAIENSAENLSQVPVPSESQNAKQDTLDLVDSEVFNVGAFISVDVAAWDVEKFVWPMIIDQFLDVGEQAISRLANFALDILDGSQHRLAITSLRRGAGASTIACSIARWSAHMKKRVLLVDANLANPSLAASIGLGPDISWVNAVRESLDASEAIIRCKSTGVCVMPLGAISDRGVLPSMLLDQLGELLRSVEHSFDLIILDVGVAETLPTELSASQHLIDAAMIVDSNVASEPFRQTKDELLKFGITKFVAAQNSI